MNVQAAIELCAYASLASGEPERDGNENEMAGCVGRGTVSCCLASLSEFEAEAARCNVQLYSMRRQQANPAGAAAARAAAGCTFARARATSSAAHMSMTREAKARRRRNRRLRHQLNAEWAPRVSQRAPDTSHCGAASRRRRQRTRPRPCPGQALA